MKALLQALLDLIVWGLAAVGIVWTVFAVAWFLMGVDWR